MSAGSQSSRRATPGKDDSAGLAPYQRLGLWDQWQLGTALGSLRAVFGVHIAQIAVSYGIDVEDQLVTIFPPPEEE